MSERWSKRVRIPEPEPDYEPCRCPFANYSDTGTTCNLGLGVEIDACDERPGPDCPGPGWYVITKEDE